MHTMNEQAIIDVYLFIGELNGYKRGTVQGKIAYGKECHHSYRLPEASGKSLCERIWLERLYKELDALIIHRLRYNSFEGFHWSVPIELDAGASLLGIEGALLGDKRMLTMTNMAGDADALEDPWFVEGLTRNHVKAASTPRLYGSSAAIHALWKDKDLEFTIEQLTIMNEQYTNGALGLADAFKEFIINNCNPKPEMSVNIFGEKFAIKCNHYRRVGEVTESYDIYDTSTQRIRRVTHTKTKQVPDLERFRSYFVTLLVHNLDSKACDYVSGKTYEKYGFVLDVHDAYIVSPIAAADVRRWYSEYMELIYTNRNTILMEYFNSIGITATANDEWNNVMSKVIPLEGEFKCRPYALK